jgi:hypothetical protein
LPTLKVSRIGMNLVPTLPYDRWIEDAMRAVIRRTLLTVATDGLPGAHHLYISFATGAPGVNLADELRARHPDEMTIVLQHQFWDLAVGEDEFQVTLKFRGRLQRLVVPFAAITGFVDPSVNFALQFRPTPEPGAQAKEGTLTATATESGPPALPVAGEPAADASGEVITLDRFRKK